MIRRRTVILLGAATAVAVIAAAAAVYQRTAETRTAVQAERVYPALEGLAGDVRQVRLVRAEGGKDGTVTMTRTGSGWILEERDGFPVRTDLVRKLLFDLGQLELIERKTADADRFDRLQLKDVGQKGSAATRVLVTTAGGETVVDLHVGKRRESITGGEPMVYVRRSADSQSYLAEGELDLRGGPVQWLPREVVNIPKDSIVAARLTAPSGAVLKLERAGNDFRIAEPPAGRKTGSQYTVNNAATVVDKLLFEDVRTAKGLAFDGKLGSGAFTTRDGLTVTIELAAAAKPEDAPWARVGIAVADGAGEEARKLAEAARTQTAGWAYRLSSFDLERLRATAESLTKPAEGS